MKYIPALLLIALIATLLYFAVEIGARIESYEEEQWVESFPWNEEPLDRIPEMLEEGWKLSEITCDGCCGSVRFKLTRTRWRRKE
jgi:hypothetical protein